jgi:para-nitrobenzyl esterase
MMTDKGTWMDSIRIAERMKAAGSIVFMYRLDWRTPVFGGMFRTPHGLDTPLVFDNPGATPKILGTGPAPQLLAARMSQAWINFASKGSPSQPKFSWPEYDADARCTALFDTQNTVVRDPDGDVRRFWESMA